MTADDFSFKLGDQPAVQFEADGENVITGLTPGSFVLTEVEANGTGYTTTYTGCGVTIAAGATSTCTITNTYRPLVVEADLSILKTVNNVTPFEGNDVVYTITVTNNGGSNATGVVVSDPLAVGLTYKSATILPASTSSLTWTVGNLANGATWSVDVTVTVGADQGGLSITNTASVDGVETDPDTTDNSASATVRPQDVTVIVPGCTDADAENYDKKANTDDGSCLYNLTVVKVVTGVTDPDYTAFSFTVDGGEPVTFDKSGTTTILVSSTTHTVVETSAPGYTTQYYSCTDIVVTGGDAVCTITNTPIPPGTEVVTACKYDDVSGAPLTGWTMYFDNNDGDEFATTTKENGCVSVVLDPENGPWSVGEALQKGWSQDAVKVSGGDLIGSAGEQSCLFFAPVESTENFAVATLVPTYSCEFYNSEEDVPPPVCSVDVVSDITNTIVEKGDAKAVLAYVHPLWTAVVDGADWIWGENPVADASVETTYTFEKSFTWNGPVTAASLKVAVDDWYTVYINGVEVGSDFSPSASYSEATADNTYNVASFIQQGANEIRIVVTNQALDIGPLNNPAGLLYKLTITGNSTDDCRATPEPEVLSCTLTADDTTIRRGGDVTLSWTSNNAVSALLDGDSVELNGSLEVENLREDTTFTLMVYDEREQSTTCSVTVDTRSGGGSSGTRVTPTVLGESDTAPTPLVLGEQVSAVPVGAPNTGRGGAAPVVPTKGLSLTQLLVPGRRITL